jgi:AraC family transcriptional regulator
MKSLGKTRKTKMSAPRATWDKPSTDETPVPVRTLERVNARAFQSIPGAQKKFEINPAASDGSEIIDCFGKVKRKYASRGFTLTETVYSSQFNVPLHAHTQASFGCVLQGVLTEICDGRVLEGDTFACVYRPAGALHEDHIHGSFTRCFNLEIGRPLLDRLQQFSVLLNSPTNLQRLAVGGIFQRLYREFLRIDDVSDLVIEGLTLELLAGISRQPSMPIDAAIPRWLKVAKDIVCSQFTRAISTMEVASLVDVHPVHLNRTFRKHFGVTIGEYTRQLRVEYARGKLVESDVPICQISIDSGFYDQSHLSNTFKQAMGVSPARYRIMFRSR